jgi:hypothetical protein
LEASEQPISKNLGFSNVEKTGIFKPVVQRQEEHSLPNGRPEPSSIRKPEFVNAPAYRPDDSKPREDHTTGESFARVYANEQARPAMVKGNTSFPSGSIIVREKLLRADATEPALVTAMIKRERGFSTATNDWEFFVIDRGLTRIKDRDTVGNCASCHASAKATDWVFKTYIP